MQELRDVLILRCCAANQESYSPQQLTFRTLPAAGGAGHAPREGVLWGLHSISMLKMLTQLEMLTQLKMLTYDSEEASLHSWGVKSPVDSRPG